MFSFIPAKTFIFVKCLLECTCMISLTWNLCIFTRRPILVSQEVSCYELKVMDQGCKSLQGMQKDAIQRDTGSNPSASKGFCFREISVKVYLHEQPSVELVHFETVSCMMWQMSHLNTWQIQLKIESRAFIRVVLISDFGRYQHSRNRLHKLYY